MGYTVVQYAGVIGGNWFMRSRIDRTGVKPFFRLLFGLFAVVAAGWLVCLQWTSLLPWVMPGLYFLLGAGSGMFTPANPTYLAKILPVHEPAPPAPPPAPLIYFPRAPAPL